MKRQNVARFLCAMLSWLACFLPIYAQGNGSHPQKKGYGPYPDAETMIRSCAPKADVRLIVALARVESSWNPLAIGVNVYKRPPPATLKETNPTQYEEDLKGFQIARKVFPQGARVKSQPVTIEDAIATAKFYMERGKSYGVHSLDLGYIQINTSNLERYKLTVEQVFDPCHNVRTGTEILQECTSRVLAHYKRKAVDREVLLGALSCYQSNNFYTSIHNGYAKNVLSGYR